MSSKMFLSALAGVAAIAVIAAPQDPSFEYPAAKHVGFDVPKDDQSSTTQSSDRVSVSFKNASIREVLDWLKDQGVNFVVGDDQVNKDSRININVVNQPVEELMKALAGAWQGQWEKKKDIWVFHKGRAFMDAPMLAGALGGTTRIAAPVEGSRLPSLRADQVWTAQGPAIATNVAPSKVGEAKVSYSPAVALDTLPYTVQGTMTKEQQAQFKKAFDKMNDPKAWEEFKKSWEKWARDYEKNYREFEKTFKDKNFEFMFDSKQFEQMQKQMEAMSKDGQLFQYKLKPGQKGFTYDGKDFKPLDEKQMKEMEKSLFEMNKNIDKMRFNNGKEFKPFDQKQMKEIQTRALEAAKAGDKLRYNGAFEPLKATRNRGLTLTRPSRFFGPEVTRSTSAHNLKAIYDSLTPAQEQKLKRLGYINYSDLNSTQRATLGVITDDSWTITYKTDKVKLTIKSDR